MTDMLLLTKRKSRGTNSTRSPSREQLTVRSPWRFVPMFCIGSRSTDFREMSQGNVYGRLSKKYQFG
jgi:hypothetical protein